MGLDNFKTTSKTRGGGTRDHEYYDILNDWVEELEDKFPIDLNINEVTISTRMSRTWGKAYEDNINGHKIKISSEFIDEHTDQEIKQVLLHEMCHAYFYEQGYSDINHSKFFRWVAGRVGADMTNMSYSNDKWQDCAMPFLQDE